MSDRPSQLTKSGFKKPFGCCGHFAICQMGKAHYRCVYRESDPETMRNCTVYLNHYKKSSITESNKQLSLF
jgi:hypothetical protein